MRGSRSMADPDDSKGPTKGSFVSILEQLQGDGHGALPRVKRASLEPLGGPVSPRPAPKPHPRSSDDQE